MSFVIYPGLKITTSLPLASTIEDSMPMPVLPPSITSPILPSKSSITCSALTGLGSLDGNIYTLLKVHLVTGKAHQIRAHLKSTGHPVAGDAKYGHKDLYKTFRREFGLRHQLLHAWRLEFGDFSSIPEKYHGIVLEAPLPKEFKDIMKGLGMDVTALRR